MTNDVIDATSKIDPGLTEETTKPAETPAKDWEAEAKRWKDLARKHEDRAKENFDKAKQFDEFTEAQKTEQEKLLARAEAAEKKAAEVELRALRAEVAAEKGLTAAQAKRLVGATREELETDADELVETFKAATKRPDFGGGDRGTDVGVKTPQITSRDQLKRMSPEEIVKAKSEGRLNEMLKIKQ